MTIQEAIEDLTQRKRFLQRTCATCWDPAIDWALDALKILQELLKNNPDTYVVGMVGLLIRKIHGDEDYE